MNKWQLSEEIERMAEVAQRRRETMESLGSTLKRITNLYGFDKREAFEVLSTMQSIIFAYTLDPSEDEPTRDEIFARADLILDEQATRLRKEKQMKEGKNDE